MSTPTPRDGDAARRLIKAAKTRNMAWFAQESRPAAERFAATQARDPFPNVPSGLLQSADVCAYARETGMLEPFDPGQLKPASYGVKLAGPYVRWDGGGNQNRYKVRSRYREQDGDKGPSQVSGELTGDGDSVLLPKNSIVFVTLEPYVRMPDYIAASFNLRIDHIYQGLLVGTGPLVDPGFVGRLSVPLHNLTSNDYKISWHDVLVWMEFIKLSPHPTWRPGWHAGHEARYVPFDPDKTKSKFVHDYIARALKDSPVESVESSIPQEVGSAERSAAGAKRQVQLISSVGGISLLLAAVGLASLLIMTWGLVADVRNGLRGERAEIDRMLERVQDTQDAIEERVQELETQQE